MQAQPVNSKDNIQTRVKYVLGPSKYTNFHFNHSTNSFKIQSLNFG